MAAGNDIVEDSSSFFTVHCPESFQQGEDLSPEDAAWVVSCLIKDVQIDDRQCESLKEVLLGILSFQTEPLASSADNGEIFARGTETEMFAPPVEAETANVTKGNEDDHVVSNNGTSPSIDSVEDSMENSFLPPYKDAEKDPSTDDIFRVWDLNNPAAEGELVSQLNKAIAARLVQSVPSRFEDADVLEDLKVEPLDYSSPSFDDLSLGIVDITLNQKK